MKRTIPLALVSLSIFTSSFAAPFMAIGDGAELFVTGALTVRSDDSIFLSSKAEDDIIFDIAPGAELTFGKDAQLKRSLTTVLAFAKYSDHDNLNTTLFAGN